MQKWEEVEDVDTLRDTAAKLGVQGADAMDRDQLIEALNTADVSDTAQGNDQMREDAEAAFGSEGSSS